MEYQLPNDDPQKSLPTLTKEQKQKGIIALQESLNRSMAKEPIYNAEIVEVTED